MVKKSLFARLFGRSEPEAETRREAPRGNNAARPTGKPTPAAKPRLSDIDFDDESDDPEPIPVKKPVGQRPVGSSPAPQKAAPEKVEAKAPPKAESKPVTPEVVVPARVEDKPLNEAPIVTKDAKPTATEPIRTAAMSRDEELSIKLNEGFTGLTTVLRGIDSKIDAQQKTSEELIVSVRRIPELMKDMPDASRAGVELLNTISRVLEFQGRTTAEMLEKMKELPTALDAMEQRVQQQVSALAKTGQDADRVAKETQTRLTSAFDGVKRVVEDVQTTSNRKQTELVEEMRRHQAKQDARVEDLLKRMGNSTKVVIFLLIVAIAALLIAVHGMVGASHGG